MKKLSNIEAQLKKIVAYKKACETFIRQLLLFFRNFHYVGYYHIGASPLICKAK